MTTHTIQFRPLAHELLDVYIKVGSTSYLQHYLHLWANADPAPYIESSFVQEVLHNDLQNKNLQSFVIYYGVEAVGILKLVIDAQIEPYSESEALLLEKIYLLREYSGQGLGKTVLEFVENRAKKLGKRLLWLDTMRKGPALKFYLDNGFKILRETSLGFAHVKIEERPMYILYKML